jgi:sugar lactone lactonase YvrE
MVAFQPWTTSRRGLGEGMRRVGDRLVTVDILAGVLTRLDPAEPGDGEELLRLDVPLGAVAPVAGSSGSWLAAAGTGVALIGPTGTVEWLDRPEDNAAVPMRVNDGCCDSQGRFWFGTMPYDEDCKGRGSVYRVDRDGSVVRVLQDFDIPNGPAFTADGSVMYLADSPRGRIYRYAMNPAKGEPVDSDLFVELPPDAGNPDGMTVDSDGGLWVAIWGAGQIHRYTATGELDRMLTLPALQPTSPVVFDGRLFVASATNGLDRPGEHDGKVLVAGIGDLTAPEATPAVLV